MRRDVLHDPVLNPWLGDVLLIFGKDGDGISRPRVASVLDDHREATVRNGQRIG
jgi:hypothetical protein